LVVIAGKLSQGKSEGPIILLVKYIGLEILFQNCIDTFYLAISFWVKCGGESQLGSKSGTKLLLEAASKLCCDLR
jgi:hypothetical protein